jgi:hypothetical protein
VRVDRKCRVGSGDHDPTARAYKLGHEPALVFPTSDVLDDRIGEPDVERVIREREPATVRNDHGDVGMGGTEGGRVR